MASPLPVSIRVLKPFFEFPDTSGAENLDSAAICARERIIRL
jgi:hypothetical protein